MTPIRHRTTTAAATLLAASLWLAPLPALADVTFEVLFDDPSGSHAAWYGVLAGHTVATGQDWVSRFGLVASSTLTVQIGFAPVATATGYSATTAFSGTVGGLGVWEQGAAFELKTGIDPNGADADIVFTVGSAGYLQNELWFDPDPLAQTAAVPTDKTDARSVLLHEFGHALGFNGWRDDFTGALPDTYASTFDILVQPGGGGLVFAGASAMALHGGPVPLTWGNYAHLGNSGDATGLLDDLMNGVTFYRGTRYQISGLDLAILQDVGLPLAPVPEPAAWALLAAGLLSVQAAARRRR